MDPELLAVCGCESLCRGERCLAVRGGARQRGGPRRTPGTLKRWHDFAYGVPFSGTTPKTTKRRQEAGTKKRRPAARVMARRGVREKIPAATYSPTRKPCSTIGSGGLDSAVGMGGRDDWRPIVHRRQQSADRKQHQKATPRGADIRAAGRLGKIPAATYSPTRKPCSTIGSGGLNCRVRDGNGWGPSDVATGNFAYAQAMCRIGRRMPRSTLVSSIWNEGDGREERPSRTSD